MIRLDKDALACDLAETYGIYDMHALPVATIATLSAGLRDNSRIKMKAAGIKASLDTLVLAALFDRLGNLMYMLSDRSGETPHAILPSLTGTEQATGKQCMSFANVSDFETARMRIIESARD
jgi:hypothetical protein